jgi:hypothetical protein
VNWFRARGIPRTDPDAMILALPDVRQPDDHSCGPAAVACVDRFFGRSVMVLPLANPVQGCSPDVVEGEFRRRTWGVVSGTMRVDDLKHLTATGRPVLCPVSLLGGHWVVVAGVERNRVHYHCPLNGRESVPVKRWYEIWTDETVKGHPYRHWGICAWPA